MLMTTVPSPSVNNECAFVLQYFYRFRCDEELSSSCASSAGPDYPHLPEESLRLSLVVPPEEILDYDHLVTTYI